MTIFSRKFLAVLAAGLASLGNVFDVRPPGKVRIGTRRDDIKNLTGDWQRIGKDAKKAVQKFDQNLKHRTLK